MIRRTEFNRVDSMIYDIDHTRDPWSVHCEVRIPGRLDAERLAAAALTAVSRHSMARARMEPFKAMDRRFHWLVDDEVTVVPLEIADCVDDAQVEAVRSRLLSRRIDLHAGPPVALALARHPDGDYLILHLSHVVGDGMSAYRLMTSICRAYAGVEDPTPDLDPLDVRNLREHAGSRTVKEATSRLRALRDMVTEGRAEGLPVRVAVEGGEPDEQGFGFHLLRLGPDDAARALAHRVKPATVNDLILAALAVAIRRFNDEHGVEPGRISMMMPVNLRPASWSQEVVSNIVSMVPVAVLASEQSTLTIAQAAVAQRTARLKEERQSGTMVDVLGFTSIWPAGVRHIAVKVSRTHVLNPILDTAVLSNLGNLPKPLDFGDGAGTATELWFSPPANMPLGTAVGATTMNEEMFLTLRYCKAQFDTAGATHLGDTLQSVLIGD